MQPQKIQTGDCIGSTRSFLCLIAVLLDSLDMAWHSMLLALLAIDSVIKDLYLIATLYFTLEGISEVNFSSNPSKFFSC